MRLNIQHECIFPMASKLTYPNAPDLAPDDYLVLGLATCFLKDAGEIQPITILEPVPSAYLEALFKDIPTSYQSLHGLTLGDVLENGVPKMIAEAKTANAQFSQDFVDRALAAARTYKMKSASQTLVPLGTMTTQINYSIEKKRILNSHSIVTAEDNVKQHQYTHMTL
jgi:hypothetical protein